MPRQRANRNAGGLRFIRRAIPMQHFLRLVLLLGLVVAPVRAQKLGVVEVRVDNSVLLVRVSGTTLRFASAAR